MRNGLRSKVVIVTMPLLTSGHVYAQRQANDFPTKPMRIVAPYLVGTPSDVGARLIGQKFTNAWGKGVVVENVAGASGNIGTERVAKANPDGYTLVLAGNAPMVINPSLYKDLPFNPLRDFAPISQEIGRAHV